MHSWRRKKENEESEAVNNHTNYGQSKCYSSEFAMITEWKYSAKCDRK